MERHFLDTLAAWFKKLQRYKVGYKNGSYHLYNLFHSPATIVESFDKMAFCKHDRVKQQQGSDTVFLKSKMYYCELEEGFWVIVSNLHFKKNVLMRNLYDDDLPLEYHFINIHLKTTKVAGKSMVNGLLLKDKTWSVYKAGHALTEYHFKNSEEKNITLFFTSKWLEKQKDQHPEIKTSKLAHFFESPNTYLMLDETETIYEGIFDELMQLGDEGISGQTEKMREICMDVLNRFIKRLNAEIISENHFKLSDKDRKNIQRAEQFLNDHVFTGFPGIEKISQKIGVSPTKLKNDFKSIHDTGLYQYFSAQQMKAAHQILLQRKHNVKDVAALLGYENASKFSAAFKKNFNVSPSVLMEE